MSHLRFYRAILSRDSDARQSRSVRLHSCTLRLWRSVRQTNMASSDSEDAVSKSQRATMKSHAATLSRVKVPRQNRTTKLQVWHGTCSNWPTPSWKQRVWHVLPCSTSTVRDRKRSSITLNKKLTRAFQRAINQRSTPPLTSSKWGSNT